MAASQPLVPQPLVQFTVWQGRPQHSVVPQSLRGRKTKKMVLKLLRHARQAAQSQHRLTGGALRHNAPRLAVRWQPQPLCSSLNSAAGRQFLLWPGMRCGAAVGGAARGERYTAIAAAASAMCERCRRPSRAAAAIMPAWCTMMRLRATEAAGRHTVVP